MQILLAAFLNVVLIALKQSGLSIYAEKSFEVCFRQQKVGLYVADLVVEELIIVELKCC